MDAWTVFWIAVFLIMVWTLRSFIAAIIIAAATGFACLVVLIGCFIFECFESFLDWRHRRKYKL